MRGQVILTDLAISVLIGVAMILLVQGRFTSLPDSPEEEAFLISEQLVASPGVPSNWTAEEVVAPGLALRRGELDPDKVDAFGELGPERLRQLFSSRYRITVTLDGEPVGEESFGEENHKFVRYVTLEGKMRELGVVLSEG